MDHKRFYLPGFLHRLWLSRAYPFHYHHMYVYDILEDRLSEARRIPGATCVFQDFSVTEDDDDSSGNEATFGVPPSHSSPLPLSPLRFLMSTLTTLSSSLLFLLSPLSSCFSPPSSSLCPSPLSQEPQTSFRMSLQSARTAFRSLEQNVEKILIRILPLAAVATKASPTENDLCSLTPTSTTSSSVVTTIATAMRITMSGEDLDMLRRYFVFLHFRNSSVYAEMMNKISYVHHDKQHPPPRLESEQEQQRVQHNQRQADESISGVRRRRQAFLDEVAYFLALQPHEKTPFGNAELNPYCWQLCNAQVSFGFAPAQVEYLHSERLFGSLDDAKDGHGVGDDDAVGSGHRPSFFFPISPTMALHVVGGLANAPGPVPGQFLVDCTHETAAEVRLRNAAMLLRTGDHDHNRRVYFSSLRATLNSLASIGGQGSSGEFGRGDDENRWYGRFRERCLERQALEATSRKLVLVDDIDEVGHGEDNGSGNNGQQRTEPQQGRGQESNRPSCVVVDDLTERIALQLKKGPCAFGSLADVYRGELTLPLGGADKMRLTVAVKCMRRHVIKDHMKWLRDEVAAWHTQQHPHVARLFGLVRLDNGSGIDSDDVWLGMVSSWCENGTIMQYLVKNPYADRLRLLIEVASGCSYLHNYSPVVIHGDLRGSNILIDADGRAIITDFGLSRVAQESFCSGNHISENDQQNERQRQILISTSFSSQFTVAARWLAPELIRAGACSGHALPITTESDVYSFGCFCLEVATGDMPFSHLNNNCAVILDVLLHGAKPSLAVGGAHLGQGIAPRARPGFWKLLDHCWSAHPEMRPPIADMLHSLYHLRDTCS